MSNTQVPINIPPQLALKSVGNNRVNVVNLVNGAVLAGLLIDPQASEKENSRMVKRVLSAYNDYCNTTYQTWCKYHNVTPVNDKGRK